MKGKPLQEFVVAYTDGTKSAMWLPKMSAKKTRAAIEMDAQAAGQEVFSIKTVAPNGSLALWVL